MCRLVQALITGASTEVGSLAGPAVTRPTDRAEHRGRDEAAEQLRIVVSEVANHAGAAADAAARQADLLETAFALHQQHGDTKCPVCGIGQLDAEWADRSHTALEADRAELADLRGSPALISIRGP